MQKTDTYILGFSDSVHDRSVCLFHGAELVVAIEEERLSRIKHGIELYKESRTDPELFAHMNLERSSAAANEERLMPAVRYCLDAAGISLDDISIIAGNSLHIAFPFRGRAIYINHHLAHAASAFYASGFERAAILLADGYGDLTDVETYETIMLARGDGNDIDLLETVTGRVTTYYDMENSLGVFYRIGTLLAGFGVFDEGKAMGLSAYGKPTHQDLVREYIRFTDRGVRIDNKGIWDACISKLKDRSSFQERADIAATFQKLLEEIMMHYAERLHALTGEKHLCIAGGVGLNCVSNANLLKRSKFEDIFVFPAPGDNGISFGAAAYAAHSLLRLPRTKRLEHAYFGRSYRPEETLEALQRQGDAVSFRLLSEDEAATTAARLIAAGDVVMWFQGGAEMGPRALGHRSILANPTETATRDYINRNVKFREMFRPLAPMVLEEEAPAYFDCKVASPFMLFSPPVAGIAQETAPAIVHCDGTARLQTVSRATNPVVYRLIEVFRSLSGVPIVLNTSFNGKDEPIVETPDHALRTFLASPVEHLFLDMYHVTKTESHT